jgi:hypothetical protein
MRIRDPGGRNFGSGILDKSRIRNTVYKIDNENENVKRVPGCTVYIYFLKQGTIQNTFLYAKNLELNV